MSISAAKFSLMKFHFDHATQLLNRYYKLFSWPTKKGVSMIDIGSGPGHLLSETKNVLPSDFEEIIGIDKSMEMVEFFNAAHKDPRISSRQLDLQTEKIPDDLKERFDFAYSSNCLQYIRKMSDALRNSNQLLKPKGELLFIWCRKNQLYDWYRDLSKIPKWSPYTNDFSDWSHYFDVEDATTKIEKEFNKANLKPLKIEEITDVYYKTNDRQDFIDLVESLDIVSQRIPSHDLPKYKEDLHKILSSETIFDANDEDGLKYKFFYPLFAVAARKI